jgi:hypothetical protein
MKLFLKILIVVVILIIAFFIVKITGEDEVKLEVASFDECEQAGNAVMESYPRRCRDESGNEFVEDIGNELEKMDLIRSDYPRPNQIVSNPLIISGEARGYWFFEGDFPVKLVDENGVVLAEGYVTAKSDSMVEEFVQYEGSISFDAGVSKKGELILMRDNPSGLSENDDQLIVPVKF